MHCGYSKEVFADNMRLSMSLSSPLAMLRAVNMASVVVHLNESDDCPGMFELHPS